MFYLDQTSHSAPAVVRNIWSLRRVPNPSMDFTGNTQIKDKTIELEMRISQKQHTVTLGDP